MKDFMITAGYSKTTFTKKSGFKDGHVICTVNEPGDYFDIFEYLPGNIEYTCNRNRKKDLIHFFVQDIELLKRDIKNIRENILSNGCI